MLSTAISEFRTQQVRMKRGDFSSDVCLILVPSFFFLYISVIRIFSLKTFQKCHHSVKDQQQTKTSSFTTTEVYIYISQTLTASTLSITKIDLSIVYDLEIYFLIY